LALIVGILGVRIMISMAFLLLSKSNPNINENQITFGAIDFQPHPTTLAPVFASLDQEIDQTIDTLHTYL
jgi:hypothetical protein